MRVLVVGASGLVGRRLVRALRADGHHVVVTSRDPDAHDWPDGVETVRWDGVGKPRLPKVDAAVNLAGERVLPKRWTAARKEVLRDSRVGLTQRLVAALPKRAVLVQASAVGYYGERPDGPCPEDREPGTDWLARLAHDWEAAARTHRGRVVLLRIGHVLDAAGGMLGELVPRIVAGRSGVVGDGRQPWPWAHWIDVVGAIQWALATDGARGAYNLAGASDPAARFHALLALQLGVRRSVPVPAWALRLRFGRAAGVLLGGQDVPHDRLADAGYEVRFTDLGAALYDLLHPGRPDTRLPRDSGAPGP